MTADTLTALRSDILMTGDAEAQITELTVSDSTKLQIHMAGDITLDTVDIEDSDVTFSSLNTAGGYAKPDASNIIGGGKFTARYVEADRSRLVIDVWNDLRIFDETTDEVSREDLMKNVLVLRDMSSGDFVKGSAAKRGAFLTSRNGTVDSTHDDYNVYTSDTGDTYFCQDNKWYVLEENNGSHRFVKLEVDPDLTGFTDRGKYSLYIGTSDETNSNYVQAYAGVLVLERSGDFYLIGTNGIEKDEHLSSDFKDAQRLLNVGARNYYDSWFAENADLTVTAHGDIQVRDGVLMTENTNANMTSNAGGIIFADYYMDTDGDGIGDALQPSRYLVKDSISTLSALGGDIRTDRMYEETSFTAIEDCIGDANAKSWYILGSKFSANLEGDVTVVGLDADSEFAAPAVQILWSNEDFYIYVRNGDAFEYVQGGVDITSTNGKVHFEAMDGDVSASNTLDLYAIASTVNISAAKDVIIPETQLNTPNSDIKLEDGKTPATGNVYHDRIFKLVDGSYLTMTESAIPDPAEHAYGTVMNIISTEGGFAGNHLTVQGALDEKGDVYAEHGISRLNITAADDIDLIFNLTGRTEEHIAQYGENIADRALTVLDGSLVKFHSEKGSVNVMDPKSDGSEPDIVLKGTEIQTAQLQLIADDCVNAPNILAQNADLYLRTTGTEADKEPNDIRVDQILGQNVHTELDSAGNIDAYHEKNLFLKLEGDVSLRLAAAQDIGTLDRFAHIDVPCTVVVDKVNNFYADLNLRDTDGDQIIPEIRDYAITQGYLTSDAEAMVQKLIAISREDYLGHSDLRFYNIILSDESLAAIRLALELKETDALAADDLVKGFALLDDQTRNDVLAALYDAAVSDGQGLKDIEAALSQQNKALADVLAEKQEIAEALNNTNNLSQQKLAQLKSRYENLLNQENTIRARIDELNDRKAEIQDRYQDYVEQDPETDQMLSQAENLLVKANQLNTDSAQFMDEAQTLGKQLAELLDQLTSHSAFNVESLQTARAAAAVVYQAAQAAANKVSAAEQSKLDQTIDAEKEQRPEAADELQQAASLAAELDDLAAKALAGSKLLNNTFVDVPARGSQIVIGEIEGELYLNNEGDINVKVDSSRTLTSIFDPDPASHILVESNPVLIGQIESRRGDVSVENVTGSIAAKTLEEGQANIIADEIDLKAKGSIGSAEQPLVTEQRDVIPSKIAGAAEDIYKDQKENETVSGAALPGKGAIGIKLAQRYDELTDETQTVEVILLLADGTELKTQMDLKDLRQLTNQANTTDGYVYNFLTDADQKTAALQVVVRYDWVRYLDIEAGTRTDAESQTGSIYLSELTGTMNIGQIKAAEDIYLSAPDGIENVLTEEEIASGKQNIYTTGENAQVTVHAGTGGLGESKNPLRVQVSGDNALMSSTSEEGIYLRGTGDLNLQFVDPTRHIEIELVAADNPGGIANLTVNDLTVGGSDTLTGYAKSLGSLELHTEAHIGTMEEPFEIVTDATKGGTLIISGNDVNIVQKKGDVLAENVVAKGDLQMDVAGSIVDASDSELTELLRQYREQLANTNAQQEVLDALQAEWNAIMNNDAEEKRKQELIDARENAVKEKAEHAEAEQAHMDAQNALNAANKALSDAKQKGDKVAIEAAQEALAKAEAEVKKAAEAHAEADAELNHAMERLQKIEAIEAKFENLEKTREDLAAAYESGNADKINAALKDYQAARADTAPYTDFVERNKSDRDIAESILKDAFGDDYREALEAADEAVRQKYQPLLNMLDEAQKNLDKANARLDELNADAETPGSIAGAQQTLDEQKQLLQDLIDRIRDAQAEGDGLAIQVGGNADIHAGSSISGSTQDPDDYVSIQVGGQLNTGSDGDVKLVSPETVEIGNAETGKNSLEIIALGNITVGTTDATEFSAAGDNIDVDLESDVLIGDIIADNESGKVDITANGSITQKPDTAIRGEQLDIDAAGNVDVDVYVDSLEIMTPGDVDLESGKSRLEIENITAGGDVSIKADGDVVSSRDDGVLFGEGNISVTGGANSNGKDITAGGSVTIHAQGNIGSPEEDLVIRTDGKVSWSNEYGLDFVTVIRSHTALDKIWDDPAHREYFVRKDDGTLEQHLRPGTGLEVYGYGLDDVFLWVGTEDLRESLFEQAHDVIRLKIIVCGETVFDYCVAIDRIIEKILQGDTRIPVIDRDTAGRYAGRRFTFRYFVGTEYNGFRYTVTIEKDGKQNVVTGMVTDGYISFYAVNEASSITVELNCNV